jgi:hypothetical protein
MPGASCSFLQHCLSSGESILSHSTIKHQSMHHWTPDHAPSGTQYSKHSPFPAPPPPLLETFSFPTLPTPPQSPPSPPPASSRYLGNLVSFCIVWFVEKRLFTVRNALYLAYAVRRHLRTVTRAALVVAWWGGIMLISNSINPVLEDVYFIILKVGRLGEVCMHGVGCVCGGGGGCVWGGYLLPAVWPAPASSCFCASACSLSVPPLISLAVSCALRGI